MNFQLQPGTLPSRAIAYLKTLPAKARISGPGLGEVLQQDHTEFAEFFKPAVAAGLIQQLRVPGFSTLFWALGDGVAVNGSTDTAADDAQVAELRAAVKKARAPRPARAAPAAPPVAVVDHSPATKPVVVHETPPDDTQATIEPPAPPAPPAALDSVTMVSVSVQPAPPDTRPRRLADVVPTELAPIVSTISREPRWARYSDGELVIENNGIRVRLPAEAAEQMLRDLVTKIGEPA